jgi:bifunctional non-homologous end joining protein LigD
MTRRWWNFHWQHPMRHIRHSTLWLKPKLVGQFEFTEWTPDHHLRHARFVGLRVDKNARDVHRET